MGKVGQEIIKQDVESVVGDLNKAAAGELCDAFRYRFLAIYASGLNARGLSEWFAESAEHEWAHMAKFMERITVLGGRPFDRPADAEVMSFTNYLVPPEEETDLYTMVIDSLEAERAAIRFYEEVVEKTRHSDPVTAHIFSEALRDEVADEDALERFLADGELERISMQAGEMDVTEEEEEAA